MIRFDFAYGRQKKGLTAFRTAQRFPGLSFNLIFVLLADRQQHFI